MQNNLNTRTDWARREPPKGGSKFELRAWLFMRVSGFLLVVLAVGHMFTMHVFNDTLNLDYEFVASRWKTISIRAFDWLLLSLSLLHGGNGVRIVLQDNIQNPKIRKFLLISLYITTLLFFILGTYAIAAFVSEV
jgi:succinate dehydrogenase / fumarate reductase membrane anchor subunit